MPSSQDKAAIAMETVFSAEEVETLQLLVDSEDNGATVEMEVQGLITLPSSSHVYFNHACLSYLSYCSL